MSLPHKLDESISREDCLAPDGHDYKQFVFTGMKNAYGVGIHFVVSTEQCKVCDGIRVTAWMTNQWYEVKNEISS